MSAMPAGGMGMPLPSMALPAPGAMAVQPTRVLQLLNMVVRDDLLDEEVCSPVDYGAVGVVGVDEIEGR